MTKYTNWLVALSNALGKGISKIVNSYMLYSWLILL